MIRGKCLWGTPLRSEACSSIHMMNVNLGVILKSKKSIFSMFYSDFKFLHPHRGYKRGGGCIFVFWDCWVAFWIQNTPPLVTNSLFLKYHRSFL